MLSTIADDIRVAGAQAQIFFIDACRGDPYVSSTLEIGPSSCGELKEPLPEGSLALFSASAGQRALDRLGDGDQDPHSVFTRTLLSHLDDAGSVVRLARAVRAEVTELATSVQYQQTPAYLDELVGPPVVGLTVISTKEEGSNTDWTKWATWSLRRPRTVAHVSLHTFPQLSVLASTAQRSARE